MRKFLTLLACALLTTGFTVGQTVRGRSVGVDDILGLLNDAGYEVFSFDLNDFLDKKYEISFAVKEYEAGKEVKETIMFVQSNKLLIADLPEADRTQARASAVDPENGVYAQSDKLTVGFYPSAADSMRMMYVSMDNMRRGHMRLDLKPVCDKSGQYKRYAYGVRPFAIDGFAEGEFIPLLLYASFWFDEKSGVFRFCGEKEIRPDLSGELLVHVPHFFVVGMTLRSENE